MDPSELEDEELEEIRSVHLVYTQNNAYDTLNSRYEDFTTIGDVLLPGTRRQAY